MAGLLVPSGGLDFINPQPDWLDLQGVSKTDRDFRADALPDGEGRSGRKNKKSAYDLRTAPGYKGASREI